MGSILRTDGSSFQPFCFQTGKKDASFFTEGFMVFFTRRYIAITIRIIGRISIYLLLAVFTVWTLTTRYSDERFRYDVQTILISFLALSTAIAYSCFRYCKWRSIILGCPKSVFLLQTRLLQRRIFIQT